MPEELTATTERAASPKASDDLTFALAQQAIVLLLTSMILDGGILFVFTAYAAIAYWAGFALISFRRRHHLTGADKILLRWGFLMLCLISPFLTSFVWNLRDK